MSLVPKLFLLGLICKKITKSCSRELFNILIPRGLGPEPPSYNQRLKVRIYSGSGLIY